VSATGGAFAIGFRELQLWSVGSFVQSGWRWPAAVIKPLATALLRKQIEINPVSDPAEAPQLLTIHFDGSIEPRGVGSVEEFKGRLYLAEAGDVVYSKIDVRNGAIGLVPGGMPRCAVSSEYPVYQVRSDIALGEYIKLVFRTDHFRQVINGMISGASGRKRVQPEQIELMDIPLPPLDTQRAIVARWQAAQAEADAAEARVDQVEAEMPRLVLHHLGIPTRQDETPPKILACNWRDLERWSVSFVTRAIAGAHDIKHSKHPVFLLGELASVSYGIQKSPKNRPGPNARPYLRVANVQKGQLDLSDVKFIEVSDIEIGSFRLKRGDLLVCEGNSADLVGRPAIWNDEIPNCVHQNHILKVRINRDAVIPEYLLEYMQTQPARSYFRSRAKFTTNLASINSNDLRELPIPLPPLDIQRTIVARVQAGRTEIAQLRGEAEQIRRAARAEVEALILGTQPGSILA
jgi:type I restriction enzyme S subunit